MKYRYWYGWLDEGNPKLCLVIFDRMDSTITNDNVYLYHTERRKRILYNRNIVRKKLRPLSRQEKLALKRVSWETINPHDYTINEEPDSDYEDYENEETLWHDEAAEEIFEDREDYTDSIERSLETGWFYPDKEGSWENNLVDPKYED